MSSYTLPYSFFVSYTATQTKVNADINRLNTIVITKQEQILPDVVECYSSNELIEKYGINSLEKKWADLFFGFLDTSSSPDFLSIFNLYEKDMPASLKGLKLNDLNSLKINGSFNLTINNVTKLIQVDLSNYVSFTDIAKAIQDKINEAGNEVIDADNEDNSQPENADFKLATFSFNNVFGGFELCSGAKGSNNNNIVISEGSVDTDLSRLLRMRIQDGASFISGKDASNFEKALNEIIALNGNFYVITPLFSLSDNELDIFANAINNTKGRFCGVIDINDIDLTQDNNKYEKYHAYNGLIMNYNQNTDKPLNSLTSAFISSMDLTANDSLKNMNFINADRYDADNIVGSGEVINRLNDSRANTLFAVGDFGNKEVFYGEGNICGDNYDNAITYIANSFMKVNIEKALFFQLAESKIVGARNPNDINALVDIGINQCERFVSAGIIVKNPILNQNEASALKNLLKNEDDINSILKNGYIFKHIRSYVDNTTKRNTTELQMVYIANTPVNRIKILATYI